MEAGEWGRAGDGGRRAVWQKIETAAHFRLSLIPLGLWPVKPLVIGTRQRAKLTGPVLSQAAQKIFLFIINPPSRQEGTYLR